MNKSIAASVAVIVSSGGLLLAMTPEQKVLLEAVQDSRATSAAAITSGRGVADVEVTDKQTAGSSIVPRHRLEFQFDGPNSLWKEFDPADPKKLIRATMVKNGKRIVYFPGDVDVPGIGHPPAGILVTSLPKRPATFELLPNAWNYQTFVAVPGPLGNEKDFFGKWAIQSYSGISNDKDNIIVNVTFPYTKDTPPKLNPGQINIEKTIVTFDMGAGGNVQKYAGITDWGVAEEEMQEAGTVTMVWKKQAVGFVPASREVIIDHQKGGKDAGHAHSLVTFVEFTPGPLEPGELDLKSLHIPDDTLVQDQVRKETYHYYDAVSDKLVGTASTATQPATRPSEPTARPVEVR